MKKNKVLKIVLIVLGALVALLAAAVLGVLFYLHSMAAGIPETLPDAPADSTQVTLTDDEIDKLLSGEITLEELTGMLTENADEPYAEEIAREVTGRLNAMTPP